MGTMSASDAAPLPRLGEVFFDVRGNSRSMRLSWYADTGVAVLSIWQGGMCTGTFRLAIGDLPRLVETLQRGPDGRQGGWDARASGQAQADPLMEPTAQVQSMEPLPGQGQPDLPADYLTGTRQYPDSRAGPPEYLAEPPDHRAVPPEYRPEPPDELRTGPAPYRPGSADYLAGPPDQAGTREYLAPPPDRRAGPPDHRAGRPDYQPARPEYQAGPPEYQAEPLEYPRGPLDHRAGLPEYQSGPPEYQAEPAEYPPGPPDHRAGSPEYQAGTPEYGAESPGYQSGSPEYQAGPPDYQPGAPDHRAGPAQYETGSSEYQAGPPEHRAGASQYETGSSEYQAGPADRWAAPPDQPGPRDRRAGPPKYQAGRPGHQAVPPQPRAEYLADLPPAAGSADPADYGTAIYVGSRRSDASDPDTSRTAAYPHDTGGQVGYQREPVGDLYRGTGPLDYHDEPPMPHYPPGTSAPTSSDALSPSPADYRAHYGTAVTDDIGHEPRRDSFPYGRPTGSRGARSRHADPDAPA
jgi:hypothetical protein